MSLADREQVIDTLKAAFVQGMLAKDEFDLRVSHAFLSRTYEELAAVTVGLPAEPTTAQPPRPARTQGEIMQRPGRMMAVATALYGLFEVSRDAVVGWLLGVTGGILLNVAERSFCRFG